MAMSKSSMADFIDVHLASIAHNPIVGNGNASSHRREMLEALCQGIIDEIIANAEITTLDGAPDSEHTGKVTA